jgi:arsenite methyltransferase
MEAHRKDTAADIAMAVKNRFAALARCPAEEQRFPIRADSAKPLGYTADDIDALPRTATESFAGVGHLLSLGALKPGHMILDSGCGAG